MPRRGPSSNFARRWIEGHSTGRSTRSSHLRAFDPASYVFADAGASYASSHEYQAHVYEMVETDLDQALAVGGSPVKAAQEVTRILRDQLRAVIEFGGLSLESYIDFQSNVRGRINRFEAGPPPLRSQQLLALLDAGTVQIPFGPHPEVTAAEDGRVTHPIDDTRSGDRGHRERRRAGAPRPSVARPIQLAAPQSPVRQGSTDAAELRRHRRRQRCH